MKKFFVWATRLASLVFPPAPLALCSAIEGIDERPREAFGTLGPISIGVEVIRDLGPRFLEPFLLFDHRQDLAFLLLGRKNWRKRLETINTRAQAANDIRKPPRIPFPQLRRRLGVEPPQHQRSRCFRENVFADHLRGHE